MAGEGLGGGGGAWAGGLCFTLFLPPPTFESTCITGNCICSRHLVTTNVHNSSRVHTNEV